MPQRPPAKRCCLHKCFALFVSTSPYSSSHKPFHAVAVPSRRRDNINNGLLRGGRWGGTGAFGVRPSRTYRTSVYRPRSAPVGKWHGRCVCILSSNGRSVSKARLARCRTVIRFRRPRTVLSVLPPSLSLRPLTVDDVAASSPAPATPPAPPPQQVRGR